MIAGMAAVLEPRGPFALTQAGRFLGAFPPLGHGGQDADGGLRVAFLRDDWEGAAGAVLRQAEPNGPVTVELRGDGPPEALLAQVARIFALDADARPLLEIGRRDPVVGEVLEDLRGLRPVLFPTPYEGAAWAILSARQQMTTAAAIRRTLVLERGETVRVDGHELRTFPRPERLLEVARIDGGQALERLRRLHAVAEAAIDGVLDVEAVRDGPEDEAARRLRSIRGIGPYGAGLVLARASGRTDVLPVAEPRVRAVVARAYGIGERDDAAFVRLAEAWRPFRTWVAFLLRNAG